MAAIVKRGKGLSVEEKRKRLCEIFYETKDFFQLRDLEKMGPKLKGIVTQSVKEILQSLVDDGLVHGEKIGSSNYFWSFPSEARITRNNKLNSLNKEIEALQSQIAEGKRAIESLLQGREQTEERQLYQSELDEVERQNRLASKELEKYREMDPDLFEAKKRELQKAKAAVNRWTENIFTLQSYCSNKFNIAKSDFSAQFEIPDDLDYV